MGTIQIRKLVVGEGRPKICVPLVGKTEEELVTAARQAKQSGVDLVEWRGDWFEQATDAVRVRAVFTQLRNCLQETPILYTFRTEAEGGEQSLAAEDYYRWLDTVAKMKLADCIDVEVFREVETAAKWMERWQQHGVKVIASYHDFSGTPTKEALLERLRCMDALGADLLKIAVMPQSRMDVLQLLCATEEMRDTYTEKPLITMAMGKLGVISRCCGEFFGSAITFGALGKTSAPGQLALPELEKVLDILHRIL